MFSRKFDFKKLHTARIERYVTPSGQVQYIIEGNWVFIEFDKEFAKIERAYNLRAQAQANKEFFDSLGKRG